LQGGTIELAGAIVEKIGRNPSLFHCPQMFLWQTNTAEATNTSAVCESLRVKPTAYFLDFLAAFLAVFLAVFLAAFLGAAAGASFKAACAAAKRATGTRYGEQLT
jgi:hypothetical protein